MMPTISAIIITKNEEARIEQCLKSLCWVDEIIVVDSGSTDSTVKICQSYPNVKLSEHFWEGFGRQKNKALSLAAGEWIFSIDADEIVTEELALEIQKTISHPDFEGYFIPRKNFYRGQWIEHSGWWPDPVLRLFKKAKGQFSDRPVHETVEVNGKQGKLSCCLEHHSFNCIADFLRKADSYSSLGARMMLQQGKRSSVALALVKSAATFFKTLVLKRGFLDGYVGILISFSNAVGVFYRYMKCLELKQGRHAR
jgi:glycosyltransferase involved in cell wall biosynthesis